MIKHITNHDDWINARMNGIGGSDAAAVIGKSPYKSNLQLWKEKTGAENAPDISNLPVIKYGKAAEPHIRGLFEQYAADLYTVEYSEFDMHINDKYPFIFATLDGILTDKKGRKGVLEIKTTEIRKSTDWHEWDDKIPDHYYIQVLHQLIATGFDYAVLTAQIRYYTANNDLRFQTRHYHCERSEHSEDIGYLLNEEKRFWDCVQNGRKPPLILPQI